MGTWIPNEIFICNPQFAVISAQLIGQLNWLEEYEASHRTLTEDTYECESDNTGYNNLMSDLLRSMGVIALAYPFNRAVYPLPSGDAIEVPT